MKERVCIYSRTAIEDDTSMQLQIAKGMDYITSNGLTLFGVIKEVGRSYNINRKTLNNILDLARKGEFDIFYTKNYDRISRDSSSAFLFIKALKDLNIKIANNNAFDDLIFNINKSLQENQDQ